MYADDICLMAPSRTSLQILLDACEKYGYKWCLAYNPSKSQAMIFGNSSSSKPLCMYGQDLKFVTSCKYLGIEVVAGKKLTFSPVKPLIKFRCAANTILNTQSSLSEPVLMKLLYTACVPNLTYACESIDYSSRQMHSLDVALNDCIRRIISFIQWESVRYFRIPFVDRNFS